MRRWQPIEAAWRALRTGLQTLGGTLTGMTIVNSSDMQTALLTAGWASLVAAITAFAMNLEAPAPIGPIEVTGEGGEPVETVEVEDPTPTPVKKSKAKAKK